MATIYRFTHLVPKVLEIKAKSQRSSQLPSAPRVCQPFQVWSERIHICLRQGSSLFMKKLLQLETLCFATSKELKVRTHGLLSSKQYPSECLCLILFACHIFLWHCSPKPAADPLCQGKHSIHFLPSHRVSKSSRNNVEVSLAATNLTEIASIQDQTQQDNTPSHTKKKNRAHYQTSNWWLDPTLRLCEITLLRLGLQRAKAIER